MELTPIPLYCTSHSLKTPIPWIQLETFDYLACSAQPGAPCSAICAAHCLGKCWCRLAQLPRERAYTAVPSCLTGCLQDHQVCHQQPVHHRQPTSQRRMNPQPAWLWTSWMYPFKQRRPRCQGHHTTPHTLPLTVLLPSYTHTQT